MRKDKLLLEVLNGSTEVQSKEDFIALLEGAVSKMLPHEIMICGIGGISADGNFSQKFLNRGYPLEYYYAMQKADGKVDSPLTKRWRETLQPVFYQSQRDEGEFPADWVALVNRFDLRNLVGHGVLDLNGSYSSYFIYSRLPGQVGKKEVDILNLITPHLHNALARISPDLPSNPAHSEAVRALSVRQLEILSWIYEGKSNWEIAKIIDTTEANVKYHVEQIYQKLGVSTRVQAVAFAKDIGILQPFRNGRK